jgi:hypothetical protein
LYLINSENGCTGKLNNTINGKFFHSVYDGKIGENDENSDGK